MSANQAPTSSHVDSRLLTVIRSRGRRRKEELAMSLLLTFVVCLLGGFSSAQRNSQDSQFCQPQTVGQRIPGQAASDWTKKVFCFYDIQDDFRPQDLNPCLCTHVVYSYVAVRKNLSFIAGKKGDLRSLASLKRKNPNLKLLVSLRPDDYFSFESAAATSSEPATPATDSPIQMNEMHQKFAKRIRDFIVRHALDGINLDWPYFAQTMASANSSREHLTLVLTAINENFQISSAQSSPSAAYLRLQSPIVTLTTSKDFYSIVDGYDFHQVNKLLDFVHLPAFDFDLNVDQFSIGHPARLHGISDAENLDTLVDLLLSSGLPSEQLVAGVPSHGVQITSKPVANLQQVNGSLSANETDGASNSTKPTTLEEQLEAAANISIVSHSEVCRVRDLVRHSNETGKESSGRWTVSRARDLTAPFAYDAEHWIGFDDETSVKLKAKYVLLRHLAGVAMFTVNNDDPAGACGFGPYPLLATVNGVFARAPLQAQAPSEVEAAGSSQRAYYTRAPAQMLTATSLVSQMFGKKLPQPQTTTPPGDLMSSASDQQPASSTPTERAAGLMSFVDIIEKYGAVNRLDATPLGAQNQPEQEERPERQLSCDKIGYQRYPRDCSRFYRCVQTPPIQAPASNASQQQVATTTTTRLQYECPSGLVFDEQYQICNWPSWSAQCTGSGEVNSITNAKFVCPNYGYFQNQENCEYFYYCSDYNRGQASQAYQFRCPFELGFDEEKLQCNWKWLVKGCNVSAPSQPPSQNNSSSAALAQKYLQSLSAAEEKSKPATTTIAPQTSTNSSEEKVLSRSRRAAAGEERANVVAGLTSRMVGLLASVDAYREHRMKKSGQHAIGASKLNSTDGQRLKYPNFVGAPQTTPASSSSQSAASSSSFRSRRRSATSAPDQPLPDVLPYKPKPPPPSIFPFLPSSALYMLVDSFRSLGEAIQGELNRYMRIAGDQMRGLFGLRGAPPKVARRNSPEASQDAEKLLTRRVKRQVSDLQALESGSGPIWQGSVRGPQIRQQDPLARPPGYPLNQLDKVAAAAVLGPEPQLYSQPSAVISKQMSGISQQEYERLIRSNRDAFNMYKQQLVGSPTDQLGAGSVLSKQVVPPPANFNRDQVVGKIVDQAQSARLAILHERQPEVPFGMPSIQSQKVQRAPNAEENPKKRRSTMAMKLATLARPTGLSLSPLLGGQQAQTTTAKSATTRGYMSFLPALSNAVVAPARNIMSRAKDINKAVHDLISTLAPGNKNNEEQNKQQQRVPVTTPLPFQPPKQFQHQSIPLRTLESNQNQFVVQNQQPKLEAHRQEPAQPPRRAPGPLLLTEDEARALSAQLDQLSKEQLEILSSKLNDEDHKAAQMQARPQNGEPQDYVTRLLKLLSESSHNPEEVKLLDQLARQLNNPAQGANDPLIEIGQPDDLALLEALGLIPQGSRFKQAGGKYSLADEKNSTGSEGHYFESQNEPEQMKHQMMQPGSMKSLMRDRPKLIQYPNMNYANQADTTMPITELPPPPQTTYNYGQQQANYKQSAHYYPTTTTTAAPFVVTQLMEEIVEKKAPPVKQTYTELIESNVTTPDGIETSFETRTKSAVSAGAGFSINSQVGIGMIPKAFGGAIPVDSPQYEINMAASSEVMSNKTQPSTATTNSTDAPAPSTRSARKKKAKGKGSKSSGDSSVKGGSLESASGSLSYVGTELDVNNQQPALTDFHYEANPQPVFGDDGSQFSASQFSDNQAANLELGASLGEGFNPIMSQAAGTEFQQQSSSSGGIRAGLIGGATLNNYNFATQPMSQFEEVVIKKKFKPFPKQVMVPQTKEFTVEEVRKEVTPAPIVQQSSFVQEESFGSRQPVEQQTVQQFSGGAALDSSSALLGGAEVDKQVKLEDSSTVASAFGEQTTDGIDKVSLTRQEIQQSQQMEEQRRSQDFQMLQFLLDQQRLQQQQQERVEESNQRVLGGKANEANSQLLSDEEAKVWPGERETSQTTTKSGKKKRKKATTARPSVSTTELPAETTLSSGKQVRLSRANNETSVAAESKQTGNRVEAAFSNFMVELKRSRNATSVVARDEQVGEKKATKKRKSRSKKGSTRSSKEEPGEAKEKRQQAARLRVELPANSRKRQSAKRNKSSQDLAKSGSSSRARISSPMAGIGGSQVVEMMPVGGEQVAIYGTKSGFMPIIRPDDPSYNNGPRNEPERDALSSSASFTSSKHEALDEMSLGGAKPADDSWKNFVRRLRDQISVVQLGSYTELLTQDQSVREVQVKLVILPASPNDQLLQADNWNHLAAHYPQLFPANRSELDLGPIDLGAPSINVESGLIDEHQEDLRYEEFGRQLEKVSKLIEVPTFKALDEIIQRSSGRLFMMHRKSDASRTLIAVIPDKPLIKQKSDKGTAANHYQRLVNSKPQTQISSTQAPTTTSNLGQQDSNLAAKVKQTPEKAATFSRAVQESIQDAIRQHYNSMKSQLKKSLAESSSTTSAPTTSSQERLWSTPSPDALARMESTLATSSTDLEMSGSSTEFSIHRLLDQTTTTTSTTTSKPVESGNYNSHAIFELDGAEPKALYGLDMSSQQADQSVYFESSLVKQETQAAANETFPPLQHSTTPPTSSKPAKAAAARFISIGSHLIASPKKLPKVVDQAYVNHFYDHISEHRLAKEAGFEGSLGSEGSTPSTNEPETTPSTSVTEDLLVPESACTRAGLFQHPFACNKFYECFWDKQLNKYTLHMFECPIKLAFDDRVVGCAMPIESSLCVNY